jgi:hypothetical protein
MEIVKIEDAVNNKRNKESITHLLYSFYFPVMIYRKIIPFLLTTRSLLHPAENDKRA